MTLLKEALLVGLTVLIFFSNESLFAAGGQSIGAAVSALVLPMNIQD